MYLGHTYNFNKAPAEVTDAFGVGYDYSSVMHYSSTAFSKNDQLKTIVPKVSTIYNISSLQVFLSLCLVAFQSRYYRLKKET